MSESSSFEKVGRLYLSGTQKSLKIEIEDPGRVFQDVYYVSVKDVMTAMKEPKKTATIVKVREEARNCPQV